MFGHRLLYGCRLGLYGSLLLRLPLLLLEVRLDAFLGQVVGEIGGAAPSLALGLAQRVVRLVAPAHGLLAGLLVHLAHLVQLHAAQPKLLAELVHAGRRVAGLLDAVSQHALESARLELALTVRPSRPLRARLGTHHGEAHLSAQLVVLALDRGVVGAVRDGVARLQIVVRYGGVDVHAAALAVGVDRDPARGVGCHLLAQQVAVLAGSLDVLGVVLGQLLGCPRDAHLEPLVLAPLVLSLHGGTEAHELLAGVTVAHLGGDAVRPVLDVLGALLALAEFRVGHAPVDVRQGLDVSR